MRKTLLLSASLLTAMGAMALDLEDGTDITPSGYKFSEGNLPTFHPYLGGTDPATINVNFGPGDVWNYISGDEYYDNSLAVLSTGMASFTHDNAKAFEKGWAIVDFGGSVGKVAVFTLMNADIVGHLTENYGNRKDDWSALPKSDQPIQGSLNFFMDPQNCPATGFVRFRMVYNIYSDNLTATPAINNVYAFSNNNDTGFTGPSINKDDCKGQDGTWDPTKWITYEFDFKISGGAIYSPYRIKMQTNGANLNDCALFIKEFSFTHFDSDETEVTQVTKDVTDHTHQLDDANFNVPTGIVAVGDTTAEYSINGNMVSFTVPAVVYNLAGMKVAEGENATLASGAYVAKVGGRSVKFIIR